MRKKLLIIFVAGSLCHIIVHSVLPNIEFSIENVILKEIYESGKHFLGFIAKLSIMASVILFGLREIFINSWEMFISNFYEKLVNKSNAHFEGIIKQIELIRENTDKLYKKFEKFMIESKVPLSIDNCQSIEEFNKLLIPPCKELFGKHIVNNDSLFSYVRKVYLDGFSKKPHPSNVEKFITVRDYTPDPNFLEWEERTKYNIHHVTFPTNNTPEKYLLRFKTTSFAPDIDAENWAQSIQVKMLVDNKSVLPTSKIPTIVDIDTGDEGFYCKKDGDWIELWFRKYIELTKECTEIECQTVTINSKVDKVLTLHTNKPTCKYKLEMNLPKNLSFIKHPFTSNKIIYSGLPESIINDLPKETKIDHDSDNHIRIIIKEWVMPGIIVNLNWIDTEPPK